MKRQIIILLGCLTLLVTGFYILKRVNLNSRYTTGQAIDSLNGVKVFYNGGIDHVSGRNVTADNYNLGLKYQCVEFVKRYYYEYLNHKMPDAYGNAKDFFDPALQNGEKNIKRNLTQYQNNNLTKPRVNDLLVFSGSIFNKFGHVAIISNVTGSKIEIIQQNPGPFSKSRESIPLIKQNEKWSIKHKRASGWLRKE